MSYGHEETRDLPLEDFLNKIRAVSTKHILYTIHALDEMNAEVELISTDEVREVTSGGEIIEDYPEDKRGHSCLMMSYTKKGRPVHVVCALKEEYLAIVTVYVPSLNKWEDGFKVRRKQS